MVFSPDNTISTIQLNMSAMKMMMMKTVDNIDDIKMIMMVMIYLDNAREVNDQCLMTMSKTLMTSNDKIMMHR